jgi:hypothetical protein
MPQMLDAVRASGAKNVVLIGGASWAQGPSATKSPLKLAQVVL